MRGRRGGCWGTGSRKERSCSHVWQTCALLWVFRLFALLPGAKPSPAEKAPRLSSCSPSVLSLPALLEGIWRCTSSAPSPPELLPGGPCRNAAAFLSCWKGRCPEGLGPGWFAGSKAVDSSFPPCGAVLAASPAFPFSEGWGAGRGGPHATSLLFCLKACSFFSKIGSTGS